MEPVTINDYHFEYGQSDETWFWGTANKGIGVFFDEKLGWCANVVINDIYFIDGLETKEEAMIAAINKYEKLMVELS